MTRVPQSFLDPFGNRRVSIADLSADISIDCLIGESNAGSLIWPQAAKRMPFVPWFDPERHGTTAHTHSTP